MLATQLARLDRKIDAVGAERRRLADLYQASFIEREELLRRGKVRWPPKTGQVAKRDSHP